MRTVLTCGLVLWATQATAQEPVKNPSAVLFTCPDHDRDTGHEIDIVAENGTVVQTISAGDPPADAQGEVRIDLNVQPIAFGRYTIRARATFGDIKSADSTPSPTWERAPGRPSNPRVQ